MYIDDVKIIYMILLLNKYKISFHKEKTKEWSLREMVVGTNSNGQIAIEVGNVGQEKKVSINCNHILIYQCAFPFHYYLFDLHHYWQFV